jgi:hypothetical protein
VNYYCAYTVHQQITADYSKYNLYVSNHVEKDCPAKENCFVTRYFGLLPFK